jgi:hypothetical protein
MTLSDPPGADVGAAAAALAALAERAAARGALVEARELLQQATALDRASFAPWMSLAGCCRALGDLAAALQAVDRALGVDARSFVALLMKASLLERLGAPHGAGAAYGVALTQAPPPDRLSPQLRAPLEHARQVHARYQDALAASLREQLDVEGPRGGPAARRLDDFIGRLTGKRRVYHQEPVLFHYPGLPELEFHDREDFPWIEGLEAATADIRQELLGVFADDAEGLEPYIAYPPNVPLDQWAELNNSPRWGSYHLLRDGLPVTAHARRCPKTMAALAAMPQPHVVRRSPAAMFSVLQPRTRIPPHTGIANTRLVVHLPLIVPDGCGFRVGAETRVWREGHAWVFDDTIEHEAWNDSDAPRTVLICDVWNPRLSGEEREAIAAVIAAMDAFEGVTPGGDGL